MRDLRHNIAGPCCRQGKVEFPAEEDEDICDDFTEEVAESDRITFVDYV